jgi:hypothetical protein
VRRAGPCGFGLFYKAYTLNKLGQSKEAWRPSPSLRKTYASSRWLDDAKALELDVNQRAGRPVAPEAESDEEPQAHAINSIMQSDPERAIPLLENILKSSQPPKVKERALLCWPRAAPRAQQVHRADRPRRRQSRPPAEGHQLPQPEAQTGSSTRISARDLRLNQRRQREARHSGCL